MVNKLKHICNKVTDFYTKQELIDGLMGIIDEANSKVRLCNNVNIEIYNNAVMEILGTGYQLTTYNGQITFWNGRQGIKSVRRVEIYEKDNRFECVPVTFETNSATYYWYFLKLNLEGKPLFIKDTVEYSEMFQKLNDNNDTLESETIESFNSFEKIVTQLESCKFKDEEGHRLENNCAFVKLKALSAEENK